MASSSTEIANLALSHLGVGKEIASLTETSSEARACNRFYETARDETLRAAEWGFARKVLALGLIEEEPTEEWGFSYTYPADCLFVRKIQSGVRSDTRSTVISYELSYGTAATVIFTDQEDAIAEYTVKVTDVARFPVDFTTAVSYRLAYLAAPRVLSISNVAKIQADVLSKWREELAVATAAAYNEEQREEPSSASEFEDARE